MIFNLMISDISKGLRWFMYKSFFYVKNRQQFQSDHESNEKTILIYPQIKNPIILNEILTKINVAFPKSNGFRFYIDAGAMMISEAKDIIRNRFGNTNHSLDELKIEPLKPGRKFEFKDFDLILCHKTVPLVGLIRHFGKTEIIDNTFYSFIESLTFQRLFFKLLPEEQKREFTDLSRMNFEKLLKSVNGKVSAYCFLTGPTINNYLDYNISGNSIKIICNSLVKNDELLKNINGPDIISFADPAFHFGASDYSIKFRESMLAVALKYKAFIVVPDFTVPLMMSWFPDLEEQIIGLETLPGSFNFPTAENLSVKATDNILTMIILPIAAALSNNIFIAGADGRDKKEGGFWKFGSNAQFADEMHTLFKMHPSFFRDRNYSDYYKKHCQVAEELASWIEASGKNISSITPSMIPAFSKRFNS